MSQLWDEGNYQGKLTSGAFGQAGTGTPMFTLNFDIDGHRKMVFLYTSDAAWERSKKVLQKLGFNGDFNNPKFSVTDKVELYMSHGEKQDGTPKEDWMVSGDGYQPAPAADDVKRRFSAKWRSEIGSASAPARPAPSKPAPTRPSAAPAKPGFGKDEAWAAFEKAGKDNNAFYAAIDEVEKSVHKTESDFGESEWKQVLDAMSIPF